MFTREEVLAKLTEFSDWVDELKKARPELDVGSLEGALGDLWDQVEVQ